MNHYNNSSKLGLAKLIFLFLISTLPLLQKLIKPTSTNLRHVHWFQLIIVLWVWFCTCMCIALISCWIVKINTVQPRLSRTSIIPTVDQKIHYHACAEGRANDLLWVWLQIEWWATDSTGLPWPKWLTEALFWTLLAMVLLYRYRS